MQFADAPTEPDTSTTDQAVETCQPATTTIYESGGADWTQILLGLLAGLLAGLGLCALRAYLAGRNNSDDEEQTDNTTAAA